VVFGKKIIAIYKEHVLIGEQHMNWVMQVLLNG